MAYSIGQKPGVGHYCCTNCNWSVTLDDPDDVLPRQLWQGAEHDV